MGKLLAPHLSGGGTFTDDQIVNRLIYSMVNEATLCLEESVVDSVQAIDATMILGAGFPPFTGGLMRYADKVGVKDIVDSLAGFETHKGGRFEPSATLRKMAEEGKVFYP